jgi:ATP-dependent DNA helicase RecG
MALLKNIEDLLNENIVEFDTFYHRNYEIREPIEVRVTPEKIEIISYPGPDRSISLADINKGKLVARRYRNRRIGEFFKELRFTEGRCIGIPKIFDSMKANGSPKPFFSTDKDRSYFMVTLPSNPFALKEEMKKVRGKKFGVKVRDKSSSVKILELIEENNYITVNELAERIGLTTRAVEKHLARLTAQGFLKKTGPDKKAKREVLKKIDI